MADYAVEVSATAERQLRKLAKTDQRQIIRAMRQLAIDPRPRGARKLRGYDDIFRIRRGRYRIIYSIENERLVIIILKVGHRKDVYRGGVFP